MTQNERVLNHLKRGLTITQSEAGNLYGITRLDARVKDLKDMGHKIGKVTEKSTNRYGDKVHYARYFLLKANEETKQ